MERKVTRYSEAFKLKVVNDLESGALRSVAEAQKVHGISGSATVKGWLRRLGRNHLLAKVVRVETADEQRELDRLRARVRELEQVLAQTQVKAVVTEGFLEVACSQLGTPVEDFKKKLDGAPSRTPSASGRRGGRP